MGSPALWGPNNIANLLQNQMLLNTGALVSSNGAKNYITYGNFENGATTGWSLGNVTLTSALPTGVPTFGSGASGNLSIAAAQSASTLSGNYSLSYFSNAASTAGDFVASQAYTIDLDDQAKVLQFNFRYSVPNNPANGNFSGTSSNSFGVAIYDVTNSAWIIPAGVFNLVQSTGSGVCSGTFQTPSNMTQFRLVIYNANATAGSILLYFDEFFCGPQITCMAPVMSDWTSYTPTVTGLGTPTNVSFKWRRVGANSEIMGTLTTGTVAGSLASFTLPTGQVLDTSVITINNLSNAAGEAFGKYQQNVQGASGSLVTAPATSTTILYLGGQIENASAVQLIPQNGSSVAANTAVISFSAFVPISGWSSNTVSSSDTDTRVIAARYTDTSGTSYASATPKTFVATTLDYDTSGSYSNNIFTVPVSGKYKVSIACNSGSVAFTAGSLQSATLRLNSSTHSYIAMINTMATATYRVSLVGSGEINCVAGDQLDVQLTYSVTNSLDTTAGRNWISFERLSGPAVVQATDSVNARYFASSSSLSGSLGNITYTTKDFDSHNAYSSGTYTIPVSGKYLVDAGLLLTATTTGANQLIQLQINKNGAAYSGPNNSYFTSTTSKPMSLIVSDIVNCVAGDTITIQASNAGSSPSITSSNSANFFSISRLGN